MLSPALLAAGRGEGITSRYGKFGGVIDTEGLAAPAERFAYVRPSYTALDPDGMHVIAGFGAPEPVFGGLGERSDIADLSMLNAGLVGFLLLPAYGFLIASLRTGSAARERRLALFEALGGGPTARTLFTVGEVSIPILIGLAISFVIITPAFITDVPLPGSDFVLYSEDVWRSLPWLGAATAGAILSIVALSILVNPRDQGRRSNRPRPGWQRHRSWWPWIFPFTLIFAVRAPELVGLEQRLPVYVAGVLSVLISLPAFVGACMGSFGSHIARISVRYNKPGMLIAGRRMAAHHRVVSRFTAALIVAICLAVQAQLWTGLLGQNATEALSTERRIGSSILSIAPYDPERMNKFYEALPSNVELLKVDESPAGPNGSGKMTISGPCFALTAVQLPCTRAPRVTDINKVDRRIRERARWSTVPYNGSLQSRLGAISDNEDSQGQVSIVAVSVNGKDIPVPRLRELAKERLGIYGTAEMLGNSWMAGAQQQKNSAQWVQLLGSIAAIVTVLAFGIGALSEFRTFSREVAPLYVLGEPSALLGTIIGWSLLLPAITATLFGSVVSYWLTSPITTHGYNPVNGSALLSLGSVGIAASTFLCVAGWGISRQTAQHWRPSPD
ncbi:hypothetical protein AB0K68_24580 [Streptomyces sp. NPDC050698]